MYGDECKFGGGKVLREGMGQATDWPPSDTLDLLITNALIIDWSGIYKVCCPVLLPPTTPSLTNYTGGHWHQRWTHSWDWQGRKPTRYAGCSRQNGLRFRYRDHRGRKNDSHRRGYRCTRTLHLPSTMARGIVNYKVNHQSLMA